MIFWLNLCCGCQGVLLTIQNQWQLRHLRTIDNYSPLYCLSPTSPTSSLTADYFHISLLLIMWQPSVLYTTTQTQHPPKEFSNVLCACNMSLRPDPLPPFTGDPLNIGNPCNPSAQNNQHSIQQLNLLYTCGIVFDEQLNFTTYIPPWHSFLDFIHLELQISTSKHSY